MTTKRRIKGPYNDAIDAPNVAPKRAIKGPYREEEPAAVNQPPEWYESTGDFMLDILRNFNDSASFGLYPKFLEATGIDPNAQQKLEDSNAVAGIIGDTVGYMLPGSAASKAASMVPKLAGYNAPKVMLREGLAAGTTSATEDLVRGGPIDPGSMAIDAALAAGTAGLFTGAIHGANRMVNPKARIRAAGDGMSELDRVKAEGFAKYAEGEGIPLTNAEAVNAMVPDKAPRINSMFDGAVTAPDANNVLSKFNNARTPKVQAAGRQMVDDMGGGIPANRASELAKDAIDDVRQGFNITTAPLLDAANKKGLPPTWLPNKDGFTEAAHASVYDNVPFRRGIEKKVGRSLKPGSVPILDETARELNVQAGKAFDAGRSTKGGIMKTEAEDLLAAIDRVAPTHAEARRISSQGRDAVNDLQKGPLGKIAEAKSPGAQRRALFGAENAVEKELVDEALLHTGDELPMGLLANHVDTAVTKKPLNYGKTVAPTQVTEDIIEGILTKAGKDSISPRLKAARAVDLAESPATPHNHTGVFGEVYGRIRDFGAKGVTEAMLDPKNIRIMGKRGAVEGLLSKAITGATLAGTQGNKNKRRKQRRVTP